MAWIRTIGPDDAEGELKDVYDEMLRTSDQIPKMRQLASLRPDAVEILDLLAKRVHFGGTTLGSEREEKIAYVTAYLLNCSYCTIAHGRRLHLRDGMTQEQLIDLACNYHDIGLDAADIAMLDYAVKVAIDPENITEADVENLRQHGFDDTAILDIALNAGYRVFVSRLAAALGIDAEERWEQLDGDFVQALTVGRKLTPATS